MRRSSVRSRPPPLQSKGLTGNREALAFGRKAEWQRRPALLSGADDGAAPAVLRSPRDGVRLLLARPRLQPVRPGGAAGLAGLRAGPCRSAEPPAALPEPAMPKPRAAPLPPERVHASALALLAMLQREGRYRLPPGEVAAFPDADVGAAARVVHEGCRKVLRAVPRARAGAAGARGRAASPCPPASTPAASA